MFPIKQILKEFNLPAVFIIFLFCVVTGFVSATESTVAPDSHEDDDNFSKATYFVLNDAPQQHNFHDASDVDWIKFFAVADEEHTITVAKAEMNCDVSIELYDTDGIALIESIDNWVEGTDGVNETLEYTFEKSGIYYVKIAQANAETYGDGTKYELSVALTGIATSYGTVYGFIADSSTGLEIDGAQISTNGGGISVSCDGYYVMPHMAGSFTISTQFQGYNPVSQSVTLSAGDSKAVDFALLPTGYEPGEESNCIFKQSVRVDTVSINILHSFRDKVLKSTSEGKRYIELYYQHSSEVNRIIREDVILRKEIRKTVTRLLPVVKNMIQGELLSLSSSQKTLITDCLERISNNADSGLKKEITNFLRDLDSNSESQAMFISCRTNT